MNWLDIVFVVILMAGGLWGLKTGLISTAFKAVGIVVGVVLAGQLSDDVGELLTDSISNDTLVTVIAYAISIGASVVAALIAGRILRTMLNMLFLGWVDKLAGLALGLIVGGALVGALITGAARLTYNFEVPTGVVPEQIVEMVLPVADTKDWLEDTLVGSTLVPVFIDLTDAIPADAFGFVPADFRIALDILEEKINLEGGDQSG